MLHQGGTCGPALLRFLRVCLFLQSNMSSLPYYYIIIGGIQWFKVLGGSFLPEITSSTKHSSLLFPFILFKPFMPLISRACEALYIVVMPCDTYSRSLENAAVSQRGRLNKLKYKKSMYVHLIALKRGGCQTYWPRHCS